MQACSPFMMTSLILCFPFFTQKKTASRSSVESVYTAMHLKKLSAVVAEIKLAISDLLAQHFNYYRFLCVFPTGKVNLLVLTKGYFNKYYKKLVCNDDNNNHKDSFEQKLTLGVGGMGVLSELPCHVYC